MNKSKLLNVILADETRLKLEVIAAKMDKTLSDAIRLIIEERYLNAPIVSRNKGLLNE